MSASLLKRCRGQLQFNTPPWSTWTKLNWSGSFGLTRHQLSFRSPLHWSPPDSSSRGCRLQSVCRCQTCRWSGAFCWHQNLQASRFLLNPAGCWHLKATVDMKHANITCQYSSSTHSKNQESHYKTLNVFFLQSMMFQYLQLNRTTFDVPVYNHVAVQIGHAFQDLPCVLAGDIFCQGPIGLQLIFDRTLTGRNRRLTSHR